VEIDQAQRHVHRQSWELYIVRSGSGRLELDGRLIDLSAGDVVEIPPGVVHRAEATPRMTVLVVMSPPLAEEGDLYHVD